MSNLENLKEFIDEHKDINYLSLSAKELTSLEDTVNDFFLDDKIKVKSSFFSNLFKELESTSTSIKKAKVKKIDELNSSFHQEYNKDKPSRESLDVSIADIATFNVQLSEDQTKYARFSKNVKEINAAVQELSTSIENYTFESIEELELIEKSLRDSRLELNQIDKNYYRKTFFGKVKGPFNIDQEKKSLEEVTKKYNLVNNDKEDITTILQNLNNISSLTNSYNNAELLDHIVNKTAKSFENELSNLKNYQLTGFLKREFERFDEKYKKFTQDADVFKIKCEKHLDNLIGQSTVLVNNKEKSLDKVKDYLESIDELKTKLQDSTKLSNKIEYNTSKLNVCKEQLNKVSSSYINDVNELHNLRKINAKLTVINENNVELFLEEIPELTSYELKLQNKELEESANILFNGYINAKANVSSALSTYKKKIEELEDIKEKHNEVNKKVDSLSYVISRSDESVKSQIVNIKGELVKQIDDSQQKSINYLQSLENRLNELQNNAGMNKQEYINAVKGAFDELQKRIDEKDYIVDEVKELKGMFQGQSRMQLENTSLTRPQSEYIEISETLRQMDTTVELPSKRIKSILQAEEGDIYWNDRFKASNNYLNRINAVKLDETKSFFEEIHYLVKASSQNGYIKSMIDSKKVNVKIVNTFLENVNRIAYS